MTHDDLLYIFKAQIEAGETSLYFMVIDADYKLVERHPVADLDGLLPMLENFVPDGCTGTMPRFRR